MHQWFCQIFISFVSAGNINAQITIPAPGDMVVNEKLGKQVLINDVKGKPIKDDYSNVSGTPYFNEEYKYANIKLTSKRAFVNVKTRIDLVTQTTYFLSTNGIEVNIYPGMVKEITYADTTKEGIIFYKFQTGFPSIDRQNGNNFYLVLAEGRCNFVKSILKKVLERKKIVFGEIDNEYESFEEYYLFAKGGMKKLKKDRDFILAELSDKQVEVNEYIQFNKTNFTNNEQLIKLFIYYNSL